MLRKAHALAVGGRLCEDSTLGLDCYLSVTLASVMPIPPKVALREVRAGCIATQNAPKVFVLVRAIRQAPAIAWRHSAHYFPHTRRSRRPPQASDDAA